MAGYAVCHRTDRHCRLSAAFLDRAAGAARDLRVGNGGASGEGTRDSRGARVADFGNDPPSELLQAAGSEPAVRTTAAGPPRPTPPPPRSFLAAGGRPRRGPRPN